MQVRSLLEGHRQMPTSLLLPSLQLRDICPCRTRKAGVFSGGPIASWARIQVPLKRVIRESKAGTAYYALKPPFKSSGGLYEQNSRAYIDRTRQTYFSSCAFDGESLSQRRSQYESQAGALKIESSLANEAGVCVVSYAVTMSEPTHQRWTLR
ncbi:hypothetical protein ARMGADRAFT_1083124 [Armillaria gallica]|uniref:Uncharacterized protein n=1 Tax=Armillaria gallica TaxID=47427 RepID=A0A2H3DFP6_ARMGA|nr:hypothetical protein ARMGADRAFT_1083124 [Armillaria gallica]